MSTLIPNATRSRRRAGQLHWLHAPAWIGPNNVPDTHPHERLEQRGPAGPESRANAKAGVWAEWTTDLLFASSKVRRVVVRRTPPLIGLTSLLFSVRGYARPTGAGPIGRPTLR